MSDAIPRLRMFAGPNGSGKTTVKRDLNKPAAWFGVYINPDDIESAVRATGLLPLAPFEITTTTAEVRAYFASSAFLRGQNLRTSADAIHCENAALDFCGLAFNSYHASVLADFLRRKALDARTSFTFETVMSAPDKVELLKEAQDRGFRTYLYFIATDSPEINIQRVKNRVADGGHDVPETKIVERYHRSIALLGEALRHTNRAYLFDTSGEPWFFAEVTNGTTIELKTGGQIPSWFEPIADQFAADSPPSAGDSDE